MTPLTRKRLRKLHAWVYGNPQLVIPAPVIGDHRFNRLPRLLDDSLADDLQWAGERDHRIVHRTQAHRLGLRFSPGPSDAEWGEQYKAVRDGHVSYDPQTARERLLGMLESNGKPLTLCYLEDEPDVSQVTPPSDKGT